MEKKKIAVAGLGYVGLSLALVLSRKHSVIITDTNREKIERFRQGDYSFADPQAQEYLAGNKVDLQAESPSESAYEDADMVFVAVSTNFDNDQGRFDTSQVENVIGLVLSANSKGLIVIRSTVPVGFTEEMRRKFQTDRILFSPEFLREGHAIYDSLHPSRIVIGDRGKYGEDLKAILLGCAEDAHVPCLMTGSGEAEVIKIMSNTYLAMRVAFFNEVDSLAEDRDLNARDIIDGIGMDPRVGAFYNNPSFGYGGYCLPKDVKQAAADLDESAGPLIRSITETNDRKKNHVVEMVCRSNPKVVGVYRLGFKKGSGNWRESAVVDVMNRLQKRGRHILLYEPELDTDALDGVEQASNLNDFFLRSDVILANRMSGELEPVKEKVYTRDLYGKD